MSSSKWNWSSVCEHGEDMHVWKGQDFGHCFEQMVILPTAHALLGIVSVYHFGRQQRGTLQGNMLHVNWPWFLVLRMVTVVFLTCVPVLQIIFSVSLEHSLPSISDGVVAGVSTLTWALHGLYVWNLRYLYEHDLRGPLSAIVAFLVVVASCAIHLHTVISRHLSNSLYRNMTEEYTTYISGAFNFIYLMSIFPNKPRVYHTNNTLQINEVDGEIEHIVKGRNRTYGAISRDKDSATTAEEGVGCFSLLTFHWVQPLMTRGASMNISSVNDLFLLPSQLNTHLVELNFQTVLKKLFNVDASCGEENKTLAVDGPSTYSPVPEVNVISHHTLPSPSAHTYQSYQTVSITPLEEHDIEQDFENLNETTSSPISNVKLFKVLNKAFGFEYYTLGILKLFADSLGFAGPVLLNYLVSFIETKSDHSYHGYLFATGLFLSTLLGTLCSTQFDYKVQKVAYKIRCALVTTVYRKSLWTSAVVQSQFSTGEIVNFMSTDTDRILNFCPSFHAFWSLPFQVTVSLVLLYQQVGIAFLAGVAFALVLIPINRWIAQKIGQLSSAMMQHKDERVKLMNELLYGIRVVKLYSWEEHFTSQINTIRSKELSCLKGRKYLDAMCVYFWATAPVLMSILTFTTYVLIGNTLTAAKVFTCLSLFLMLISPLNSFPWVINGLVEAWVSLKRVEKFICLKNSDTSQYYSSKELEGDTVILLKNAHFSWMKSNDETDEGSDDNVTKTQDVEEINLRIHQGQYVGIVGKVGSGKSSLLNAIIGEMRKTQGEINVQDLDKGFAYVAQEPWVQHATVRDNILFGSPFDGQRYDQVIEACALTDDFKVMPAGDLTEIGENGITLSGGQRARVALARAVYQDKDLYLLDDPLSAVDAHVAKHIYTNCIMGLLRGKTRVLCTHHARFLKHADWVIVMEEGRIIQSGVPSDVLAHIHLVEDSSNNSKEDEPKIDNIETERFGDSLVLEEERQKGVVKGIVYKSYWRSVGTCLSPLVLLTLFLMQASRNCGDWWLSYWVTHTAENSIANLSGTFNMTNLTSAEDNLMFYLGIFGGLAGLNSVFTLLRAFLFAYGGLCAAGIIHKRLLSSILKAPLSFFDVTPIGRIVNRFSSDLYAVDDSLPFTLNIFLAQMYGIIGTLVLTCYGLPWFALCLVPMAAVYYKIQHYYRFTSRELKRLSSVTLSPIYAHFSETITGLATIRSMRHSLRFCDENKTRLDINQRAQFATQLSSSWLDLRLRLLGVAMVTCLSMIAVIQHQLTSVDAGLVGLAISYSLSVTNLLGGVVMFFTATEKEFVSVERCQHYINETPSENWSGSLFPPTVWPSEGVLEFVKVCLQYRDTLSPALRGISFKTRPGEKVGIVGRTGAGKSSLFLVLFRLVEASQGRVLVDGVDLKYLDLQDIRSRFAIIPQDPFLFSGSVRLNLDPTGSHTDPDLLSVLERCHLRTCVEKMGGLDATVTQRGREFSVGQRQLLCLARAMLTRAKILCIDEATASVDMETDGLIQHTIQQEFRDSTVLTIAHRIHTVLDSQRVMVLKDGTVAEFAPPDELLANKNSLFYSLVHGS